MRDICSHSFISDAHPAQRVRHSYHPGDTSPEQKKIASDLTDKLRGAVRCGSRERSVALGLGMFLVAVFFDVPGILTTILRRPIRSGDQIFGVLAGNRTLVTRVLDAFLGNPSHHQPCPLTTPPLESMNRIHESNRRRASNPHPPITPRPSVEFPPIHTYPFDIHSPHSPRASVARDAPAESTRGTAGQNDRLFSERLPRACSERP